METQVKFPYFLFFVFSITILYTCTSHVAFYTVIDTITSQIRSRTDYLKQVLIFYRCFYIHIWWKIFIGGF